MELRTQRLRLREIETDDAHAIVEAVGNINVSQWLLQVPYPYQPSDASHWIALVQQHRHQNPRKDYELAIEKLDESGQIGAIGLNIDYPTIGTQVGYWLAEPYWQQGMMKEALEAILDFAFKQLKCPQVAVPIFASNQASQALAQSLGATFKEDSADLKISKATGEKHTEKVYVFLREQWLA